MDKNIKEIIGSLAVKLIEQMPAIAVLIYITWQQQQQLNQLWQVCILAAQNAK